MRQMLVVQDWGYNRLYLRHKNAIVWVNLDDHTYRDVTKSPIEDVDTTLYGISQELSSTETQEEGAWLCEIYEHASMQENIKMMENLELDEAYMPQPISTDKIDEHVWMQVLSTICIRCTERSPDPIRLKRKIYMRSCGRMS